MAWVTQNRLVVAYNNRVRVENIAALTVANITADTYFPESNLKYPDPTLKLKTSATSGGDRVITIQFTGAQNINCAGVLAHNFVTQGYETVNVQYSSNGSAWNNVGTGTINLTSNINPNFLLRFSPQTVAYWRFIFAMSSGTRQAFEVGMLFLGTYSEFTRHPLPESGFKIHKDPHLETIQSAGGQAWFQQGHGTFSESAEIELVRVQSADAITVEDVMFNKNIRQIVAIVPPDQVGAQFPVLGQHTFGMIEGLTKVPRSNFDGTSSYDMTLAFTGAV